MRSALKEQTSPGGLRARISGLLAGRAGRGPGRKKWKRIAVAALAAAVLIGVGTHFLGGGQTAAAMATAYSTAQVTRMDLTSSITGSGTLEAANSYSVTTLVEGTILSDTFEEGDQVEEGTVLYTIDSSDTDSSLEQARLSVDQAQRNYDSMVAQRADLTVRASIAGQVISLEVEVGDEVSAGQTVATVRDTDTMELTVHFPADDAAEFYVGQGATVTLDSTFETLSGTVGAISSVDTVLTGNRIVRAVTVQVQNPGGITTTQSATAEVGGVGSSDSAAFAYGGEETVTAKLSGTVAAISVGEGGYVGKNGAVLTLTSDDLEDQIQSAYESLENATLSLENQSEQLDNYTITAPISGTVIDKYYAAGENAEANTTMCTIYDLSYLTMTLSVDELDISSLAVGQTVTVTADAVEDQVYTGVVTKVSVAGTASGGVTPVSCLDVDAPITCPAEVTLEEVGELDRLEPYGAGNPRPVFALLGATVDVMQPVGQGRHLKFRLSKGTCRFDAIFFSMTEAESGVAAGMRVDAAFYLQANTFRGNTTLQLQLIDIRPSLTPSRHEAADLDLLRRLLAGEDLTGQERARLQTSRSQFEKYWKTLEPQLRHGKAETDALPFLRRLSALSGGGESFLRAGLALAVFRERGLIALSAHGDQMTLSLNPIQGKVDLFASPYLSRLREDPAGRNGGAVS